MKLYVSGNCQAVAVVNCLAVMNRDVQVERLPRTIDPADVAADDDLVLLQPSPSAPWTMRSPRHNEILWPRVWFNAFHPDLVFLSSWNSLVDAPFGNEHSALALYAWHRRLSVAETVRLFTESVFDRLGYLRYWEPAKQALLNEGERIGFPLDAMFARWQRSGAFMHMSNHPVLTVLADVARGLAARANLPVLVERAEYYLIDAQCDAGVWPIYPEVGAALGLAGAYAFMKPQPPGRTSAPQLLDLAEFVQQCFAFYALVPPESLASRRLESPLYRDLENLARKTPRKNGSAPATERGRNVNYAPSAPLQPYQYWRRAVEGVPAAALDPVGPPPFEIRRATRIATAGSCFAQHISRALVRAGWNFYVTEPPPSHLSAGEASRAGYGVFSTRSGNVYTARALLQLFDRVYGTFVPQDDAWERRDGTFADPFRPRIQPGGFATVADLHASRERHFEAVRAMFEGLDVFVFTLGLTEAWRAKSDGAVFPLAPDLDAGRIEPARYEFFNAGPEDVATDLEAVLDRLHGVNPSAKVILTVSPVPLLATYEPRHVLVSTTYSKSVLRVAAEHVERSRRNVAYFPAYEIVTGAFNRGAYFEPDLRSVTPAAVDHVMRLFFTRWATDEPVPTDLALMLADENRAGAELICDEEALFEREPAESEPELRRSVVADYRERRLPPEERTVAAVMPVLTPSSMRAAFDVALPSAMATRSVITVPCTVTNAGDTALSTGRDHPVYLCYRWYAENGEAAEVGNAIHTPLAGRLEPGASAELPLRIASPEREGRYQLKVTLLQSEVAWFDDVDAASGAAGFVDVRGSLAVAATISPGRTGSA